MHKLLGLCIDRLVIYLSIAGNLCISSLGNLCIIILKNVALFLIRSFPFHCILYDPIKIVVNMLSNCFVTWVLKQARELFKIIILFQSIGHFLNQIRLFRRNSNNISLLKWKSLAFYSFFRQS